MWHILIGALFFGAILGGCSTNKVPETAKVEQPAVMENPINIEKAKVSSSPLALQNLADKLVADLVATIPVTTNIDKVAIATPVEVSSLEKTDWLGRELAEYFVSALHQRGFSVLEYKIKGWLEITANGDYVYSRDWQKLASKASVSRVLSGTMSRNDGGVMVYARIVNLKTSMVEGSSEIFIPDSVLPSCYRNYPRTCGDNPVVTTTTVKPVNNYVYKAPKKTNAESITKTSNKTVAPPVPKKVANTTVANKKSSTPKQAQVGPIVLNNVNSSTTVRKQAVDGSEVTSNGTEGLACQDCKGNKNNCHAKCSDPLIYPAGTHSYGSMLVRDVGTQSQYDRR